MFRLTGVFVMLCGVSGLLHSWICGQKEGQGQIAEMIYFLRKSIFVMENEKVKVADVLKGYLSGHSRRKEEKEWTLLEQSLLEIVKRLSTNNYPCGQMVWEEVFRETEKEWAVDSDTFQIIIQAGNGFFGRSRAENISFLKKSLIDLEQQLERKKEEDLRERKVWVPVGMLGTAMMAILFL